MRKAAMNQLLTSTLFTLSVAALLISKNAQAQELKNFKDFCENSDLRNCDIKTNTPSSFVWDASLKSFKTLADSPSKIVLTREQFERDSVKNLIEVAGGSSVIEFVNSLPWTSLRMQDNAIELTNTSEASIEANGMVLSTEANSKLLIHTAHKIEAVGLFMETRVHGRMPVREINLESPGKVELVTDTLIISEIPLEFLIPSNFPSPAQYFVEPVISADKVIRSIAEVMFEEKNEWNKILDIDLRKKNVDVLKDLSRGGTENSKFKELFELAFNNVNKVTIGGAMSSPLRIALDTKVECHLHIINVPLLGTFNAKLKIDDSFGISSATLDRDKDQVEAEITGLKVSKFGSLKKLVVDGDELKLKISRIPGYIPLTGEVQEDAMQLKSVSCETVN